MDIQKILGCVDHTLLKQSATYEDMKVIIDDAIKYGTATVCIPASFVKWAKEYAGDKMKICTVIGFPNGYSTTETKVFETKNAIKNGADEIDMVININELKSGNYIYVLNEIRKIKRACKDHVLKVIIETCLLTEEEKVMMCKLVTRAKADYIKTSTGFAGGGATFEDVKLMRKKSGKNVKVKAAGGISNLEDAEKMIALGAERLGTSRLVAQVKSENL